MSVRALLLAQSLLLLVLTAAPALVPVYSQQDTERYEIVHSEAGKGGVKLLYASKKGGVDSVREFEVETLLTLNNHKDYKTGDNRDVIATDSQKNTVYILAKQHGITSPEEFGILLAKHFISQYSWVVKARVTISSRPWQRIMDTQGRPHNHAFISSSGAERVASVSHSRGEAPVVAAGIRKLRVLKTTQSAFTNFVNDEFRTLPDQHDRLLSTIVSTDWTYGDSPPDYDDTYTTVLATVLENFAGPADTGVFSPSVQNLQYLTQNTVLEKVPQISYITITMPNVHYIPFDFSRFPQVPGLVASEGEVYTALDKPSGVIRSTLSRTVNTTEYTIASEDNTCVAVGASAVIPGMAAWCDDICYSHGRLTAACPADRCRCVGERVSGI